MAFRIHESVIRGEIDNRVKGVVTGKIQVVGREEPILIDLRGNAQPDLAGCFLTFTNPLKPLPDPHLDSLTLLQKGTIGDLTAARKVRVFDVPVEEALAMIRRKEKPPEHMANCLYLEWFSESNGRVVIESADYQLIISPPEWRMTSEEDEERAEEAAAGMLRFMQRLTDAVEKQKKIQKNPEEDWDEHDYEKFLRESDARTEKYMELEDRFGDSEDAEEKISEFMGWDVDSIEKIGEPTPSDPDEANAISDETLNEPDPTREGIDWIRTETGELRHPLQHRCYQSAFRFRRSVQEIDPDFSEDPKLSEAEIEFTMTAVKLAGALNGIAQGRPPHDTAFTVAYVKRALGHLHRAQAGLESVAAEKRLPADLINETRHELFAIREEIIRLMNRLRGRR